MILIKNGLLMDPQSGLSQTGDVLLKDGQIAEISPSLSVADHTTVIDATGLVVAPGLVDIHVHFREPGFEYKEDILTGAQAGAKGGFTTVICMANTKPVIDNEITLQYVLEKAKKAPIHVLACGAISQGFKGAELTNMKRLHRMGAVGFTDDGLPLMNTAVVRDAMLLAKKLDVPLSFHEEDSSFIDLAGINEGAVSRQLGFYGAPAVAEDSMVARDSMLALETGAKVNIQHISSKNAVEQIRLAQKLGANITAEVTPQHFSATEDLVLRQGTLAKVNPPLRTEEDRLALIAGLKDNTISIIATDHAPHSPEEKKRPMAQAPSGMIGLETALALGITHLVREDHLSLMELLEKMTINPARLYNLDAGVLQQGAPADILLFDLNEEWTVTDNFASKSKNSPFIGDSLFGKVKMTICGGEIVYRES